MLSVLGLGLNLVIAPLGYDDNDNRGSERESKFVW